MSIPDSQGTSAYLKGKQKVARETRDCLVNETGVQLGHCDIVRAQGRFVDDNCFMD